jgi:hypothetical protein
VILPPPIVIALDGTAPTAWTTYLTPASTWRSGDVPVTIAFAGELATIKDDLRALLDVSGRAWSVPSCTRAGFIAAEPRALTGSEAENGRNDIVVHTTDWPAPLATGAAGHTILYTLGDRIIEADIHLNAKDFTFAVGALPDRIDLQGLLIHELGHVLGIGHSADARATMNAGLPSGIAARSLEKDDRDAVCALYPGVGSTCATVPCPASFACVGFTCERAGELAVDGAECAPASEVRRCEGAGDSARCIQTTIGERCARPCENDAACGVGLRCIAIAANDSVCLPLTAGIDAGVDAAIDASGPAPEPSSSDGCACSSTTRRGDARHFVIACCAFLIARKRPRR